MMVPMKGWVLGVAAVVGLMVTCCGDDTSATSSCTPGDTQLCYCTANSQGVQVCDDSGSWGACEGCSSGTNEETWEDDTSGTSLVWQNPAADAPLGWDAAVSYCDDLIWAGHEDWRLPSISELRSLIRGCPATETGGACGIADGCLDSSCSGVDCAGCADMGGPGPEGCYWEAELMGPCSTYWSSSDHSQHAFFVWFSIGAVLHVVKGELNYLRCVRP